MTDAEVLQEILHRYAAINRKEAIEPAIRRLLQVVDEVFPIEKATVLRASDILVRFRGLSARDDAIHLAAMEHHGIQTIMSFDAGYDQWPGIERLYSVA